jgi:hypothetical protein
VSDVDLVNQEYKAVIKKGGQYIEVKRPIKTIAVPFWKETITGAKPSHFVFTENLEPGPKKIRREQVTRRWEEHVKKKLGIQADFYKLKHLNTTEVVDRLNEKEAAKLNGHVDTKMVKKHYDVKQKTRKDALIKELDNSFAPKKVKKAS